MDELDPRLGGVSFFRPARAYHEADSITPRRPTAVRRTPSNLLPPWQAGATMRALVRHPATTAWISRLPRLARLARQELPLATLVAGAGIEPATYGL
jgi:hypothetical protein